MPVRLLSSSVFKWPNKAEVEQAIRAWSLTTAKKHLELRRLGYFGSYARGDWGVGSDLDLVAIVAAADEPFQRRAITWEVESLPVPAQLLVYTQAEWQQLQDEGGRFARTLRRETVWVFPESEETGI